MCQGQMRRVGEFRESGRRLRRVRWFCVFGHLLPCPVVSRPRRLRRNHRNHCLQLAGASLETPATPAALKALLQSRLEFLSPERTPRIRAAPLAPDSAPRTPTLSTSDPAPADRKRTGSATSARRAGASHSDTARSTHAPSRTATRATPPASERRQNAHGFAPVPVACGLWRADKRVGISRGTPVRNMLCPAGHREAVPALRPSGPGIGRVGCRVKIGDEISSGCFIASRKRLTRRKTSRICTGCGGN